MIELDLSIAERMCGIGCNEDEVIKQFYILPEPEITLDEQGQTVEEKQ